MRPRVSLPLWGDLCEGAEWIQRDQDRSSWARNMSLFLSVPQILPLGCHSFVSLTFRLFKR